LAFKNFIYGGYSRVGLTLAGFNPTDSPERFLLILEQIDHLNGLDFSVETDQPISSLPFFPLRLQNPLQYHQESTAAFVVPGW
jgi:hypothetical protein